MPLKSVFLPLVSSTSKLSLHKCCIHLFSQSTKMPGTLPHSQQWRKHTYFLPVSKNLKTSQCQIPRPQARRLWVWNRGQGPAFPLMHTAWRSLWEMLAWSTSSKLLSRACSSRAWSAPMAGHSRPSHSSPPPTCLGCRLLTAPSAFWVCPVHSVHYLATPSTMGISYPESIQNSNAHSLSNSCFAYRAGSKTEMPTAPRPHFRYTGTFSPVVGILLYCKGTPANNIQIPGTSASRVPGNLAHNKHPNRS